MEIIPVIDVRHGVAVRAVAGDRERYRPLETPLAGSADPIAVALGFLSLYPFRTLYVADLDGIEGPGADAALQEKLAGAWHGCGSEVWIDDGSASPLVAAAGCVRVVGSESLRAALIPDGERDWVLSLDFRGDTLVGPSELLHRPGLWPERVIVMTLARVGTGSGPDLERVRAVMARAGARRVYAAGGVRGRGDLLALRDIGAAGVLVASALHDGQIKTGDLEEVAGS
jgi:phosphoribosylformimino-5-aminoimidazole carboxamide ribotide isomerase